MSRLTPELKALVEKANSLVRSGELKRMPRLFGSKAGEPMQFSMAGPESGGLHHSKPHSHTMEELAVMPDSEFRELVKSRRATGKAAHAMTGKALERRIILMAVDGGLEPWQIGIGEAPDDASTEETMPVQYSIGDDETDAKPMDLTPAQVKRIVDKQSETCGILRGQN